MGDTGGLIAPGELRADAVKCTVFGSLWIDCEVGMTGTVERITDSSEGLGITGFEDHWPLSILVVLDVIACWEEILEGRRILVDLDGYLNDFHMSETQDIS